ncbi:hypothetical protein HQ393_10055 [Chitinibacter bivalviorum]|uniref:Uncharacterized protein n=1 Tax=Chitinibacter bivalviorum TaxID=2739434 RepID=A0A7H9BIS5_9NEIS|nr:hypothetical protein [Chitinibacter bivalviorum]QLG88557.1 hypothetical protein HQ393_10055 [Chitinibacter bivalviorum]
MTTELQAKLAALQAENEVLRDRLHDKEANLEDLRTTMRLLEHKPINNKSVKWLWWLFRR